MKPRLQAVLVCVVALVALAGCLSWVAFHESWARDRLLGGVCEGVLPGKEMRAVLGEGPVEEKRYQNRGSGTLTSARDPLDVRCAVRRKQAADAEAGTTRDASVEVLVHSTAAAGELDGVDARSIPVRSSLPPAPLGRGWRGVFADLSGSATAKSADAGTSVQLDCARNPNDLVVTVRTKEDGKSVDNPANRLRYARVATATAEKAASKWGCRTTEGKPLRTVPLPVSKGEHIPLADATGTCAGLPARARTADEAWESDRTRAPLESCVLGTAKSTPRLKLHAYYGAYAVEWRAVRREAGARDGGKGDGGTLPAGGRWATATCGARGAVFEVRPAPGREKLSGAAREHAHDALEEFAERSAAAHGCGSVRGG